MNTSLTKQLSELGFSDKEASLYIATLELGEATATDIANRARVERTTSYNILPSLVKSGLIDTTEKKGIKYFFVADVNLLLKKKETALHEMRLLIPKLKAIHSILPRRPKITTYEGLEGFKRIYSDFIDNAVPGQEVLAYAGTKNIFEHVPEHILVEYMNKRIDKKLPLRVITDKTNYSEALFAEGQTKLRQIKFAGTDSFNFLGETILYNGKVAMISYTEGFLGTIIESKEIYTMHKEVFEELWKKL